MKKMIRSISYPGLVVTVSELCPVTDLFYRIFVTGCTRSCDILGQPFCHSGDIFIPRCSIRYTTVTLTSIISLLRASQRATSMPIGHGVYSLSNKTPHRKISRILEAARSGVIIMASLWNLIGVSAILLGRRPSNFEAIGGLWNHISWLREVARFGGKTS